MKRGILRALSLAIACVFLVTSCAREYYRISGFIPTAKAASKTAPHTLLVDPVVITGSTRYYRDMGDIVTRPPPNVENLEEYLTAAAVDYLSAARLFDEVVDGGEADWELSGELSSFYLAIRTPTGWIILAIAGSVAFVVGTGALGIYLIAHIATCSEFAIPGWVWWTMGGGAVATTAGTVGGFASEYLACEMVVNYELSDGGDEPLLSGTYTGYAEDADLENYNGVVSAATNDCLGRLTADLAATLATE
jgi:hypothetical protein